MSNRVIKNTYAGQKEILKFNDYVATVVTVDDTGIVADADGKKIVKAGTIVGGKTKVVLLNPGEYVEDKSVAAVKAELVVGSTDNNKIKFTAKEAGTGGNDIKITFTDPSANKEKTTVAVTGKSIVVTLSYAESAITATANDVITAIKASESASALVDVKAVGTGESLVVAKTQTALADGAAGSVSNPEGVLLYDVDVTNGPREAAMVIYGYIDVNKIDPLIPYSAAASSLPKITFMK